VSAVISYRHEQLLLLGDAERDMVREECREPRPARPDDDIGRTCRSRSSYPRRSASSITRRCAFRAQGVANGYADGSLQFNSGARAFKARWLSRFGPCFRPLASGQVVMRPPTKERSTR
jgi:hypothetical protein